MTLNRKMDPANRLSCLPTALMLPPRTLAGRGALMRLLSECAAFGSRGLLVCSGSLARSGVLRRMLEQAPDSVTVAVRQHAGGEPTLAQVETLLDEARALAPDWVAAVGGGSVLDLARAAAGLLRASRPVADYHAGAPIESSNLPFIAAPTTAGTGSEATTVSVLINGATGEKKSIRHPSFMARLVVLDTESLAHCPPAVLAASGMDAFVQAVESGFSRHATGLTLDLSVRALRQVSEALPTAYAFALQQTGATGGAVVSPEALAAAHDALLSGSYLAGIALANARLGLVHGLAHPLGARYAQPHGRVCAVCLPPVLAFNRPAVPARYALLSEAVGVDLMDRTRQLIDALGIDSPFAGRVLQHRDAILQETLASGSTSANPRDVTACDINRLLDGLFETGGRDVRPCPA